MKESVTYRCPFCPFMRHDRVMVQKHIANRHWMLVAMPHVIFRKAGELQPKERHVPGRD